MDRGEGSGLRQEVQRLPSQAAVIKIGGTFCNPEYWVMAWR